MFIGSGVALVTPFKNGKVDEKGLAQLIEEQISAGTRFIVPVGTTGESATLSHEEHDRVVEIAVQVAHQRIPVLAGAGSNSTEEAIRLTAHAKKAGADGVLQVNPYYNRPSQEGLFRHFEAIAGQVEIPIVLYNIPGRTGVNMSVETMARLAKIDTIVGVKEASGSLTQVSQIIEQCPENFVVLSGEDALTFPMLALGAKGAISVTANILPDKCARMFSALEQNDWEAARKFHYELEEINQALFIETNPVPIKTALGMVKKISAEVRLPLVPLSKENENRLREVLRHYGLL